MTGSTKVYSAPRLEALSLRSTRDVHVDINGVPGPDVNIVIGLGS